MRLAASIASGTETGAVAARDGSSPFLAARLGEHGTVEAHDVTDAAHAGDPVAIALLTRSGQLVGEMLSTVVNFYNPTVIVLGGSVVAAGDLVLATVRRHCTSARCRWPRATCASFGRRTA